MSALASAVLPSWSGRAKLLLAIALLVVGIGLCYRLGMIPHLWYDEGAHLHVAKNLATNGVYADYSSEGNRYTGPVLGVGPTVIVPIASVFALFGIDVTLARAVVVLYGIGVLVALFALCRNLVDRECAALSVVAIFAVPEFIFFGRSVLGEIPGLFFVLAGLWLWLRPKRPGLLGLSAIGVLFGLASITKNQYALIVAPSLAISWLLDLILYRNYGWKHFVVPGAIAGAMYGAWTYFVLFVLGSAERDVAEDLQILTATSEYALFQWPVIQNLKILWWSYPATALAYIAAFVFWLLFERTKSGSPQQWDTLVVFAAMAGLFYLSSLGWTRYAFPAMCLAAPIVTVSIYRIAQGLPMLWRLSVSMGDRAKKRARITGAALAAGLVSVAVAGELIFWVNAPDNRSAFEMAAYLDANVPRDEVIETLEQEFAVLTDHVYHSPRQSKIVEVTAEFVRRNRELGRNYDHIEYSIDARYVLVKGPPHLAADFYSRTRLAGYRPLYTVDRYTLYRRADESFDGGS